jgi:WD40 repeat protein
MDAPPTEPNSAEILAAASGSQQPAPDGAPRKSNNWVPRRLTSNQRRRLVDALVEAFDHGGIERLASVGLGVPLGEIVGPQQPLPEIALKLVEWAEARGQLAEFDSAAKEINPGNTLLQGWLLASEILRDTPYRGLFAFRENDANVFFGRDAFADQLAKAVAARPVVAVIGPSGSGKSSVVFAGLTPRLRAVGGWIVASFRPGADPFEALTAPLVPLLEPTMSETDRLAERSKLTAALREGTVKLGDVLERIREKQDAAPRLLLIADQFEELFTLTRDDASRRAFLDVLLSAFPQVAESPAGLPAVVLMPTLRADYLSQALSYPSLVEALQGTDLKLGPMSRDELRQAIERPAALHGVALEAGLTERILEDVGEEPGNLPLLEFALTRLWEEQEDELLTHDAYEAIGEVDGALATHAEEVVSRIGGDTERIRQVFTQLVRPGEGTSDTRRQAIREELGEAGWALVTQLASEKLVVTDHDEQTGRDTVEVAHEALIREWPSLRRWMDLDRDFRRWQERLRGDLQAWEEMGRDPGALLRGAPLAVAKEWLSQRGPELSAAERDYIAASVEAWETARQAERRRRQRSVALLGMGLVVALALLAATVWQWRRAESEAVATERQARVSLVQAMAYQAPVQHEFGEDERGALLARQAYLFDQRSGGWLNSQVDERLRAALNVPNFSTVLRGGEGWISSISFSPDSQMVAASGCADRVISENALSCAKGSVLLWRTTDLDTPTVLSGDALEFTDVAFSPDGQTLAAAGCTERESWRCIQSELRVWNVASGVSSVLPRSSGVTAVAFSPDGQILAASSGAHVILWDLSQPDPTRSVLDAAKGGTTEVAFGPTGRILAAAGCSVRVAKTCQRNEVQVWDLNLAQTSSTVLTYDETESRTDFVELAFHPAGDRIAAGTSGGNILLWDLSHPDVAPDTFPRIRRGPIPDRVTSIAFSPDGRTIAVGSSDPGWGGDVALLDFDNPEAAPIFLPRWTGRINSVAFSPDGRLLASGGEDPTVVLRLWQMRQVAAPSILESEVDRAANDVAFSLDGLTVASVHDRDVTRLWDAQDLTAPPRILPTPPPSMLQGSGGFTVEGEVAFSEDGQFLASNTGGSQVSLWDLQLPANSPRLLTSEDELIKCMTFSPDGRTLATGGDKGTIMLWNLEDLSKAPVTLEGHEDYVTSVAFSPDGQLLASGSWDTTVRLWSVDRPTDLPVVLRDGEDRVNAVAFSPDGQLLASGGGDRKVRLWDLKEPATAPVNLTGHEQAVTGLSFSPDGQLLASGSWDTTVRLWSISRPTAEPVVLRGHADRVTSVAFSPDGKRLASSSIDSTVRLWIGPAEVLAELVCQNVGRNLRTEEWQQFVSEDIPYEQTCPAVPPGDETGSWGISSPAAGGSRSEGRAVAATPS